jgi:hypothetical protein
VAVLVLTLCGAAHAKDSWHRVGASTFGGPCEPGESMGYRGDHLPSRPYSFAELNMGSALGGLPYGARIRVLNPRNHRRLNIVKRDIGGGGGPVFGVPRAIDLYWPVTRYLTPGASCWSWTGVVLWRRL